MSKFKKFMEENKTLILGAIAVSAYAVRSYKQGYDDGRNDTKLYVHTDLSEDMKPGESVMAYVPRNEEE